MNILKKLFGPSKEEVWEDLSKKLNASFIKGTDLWHGDKVVAKVDEWTITYDIFTVSNDESICFDYTRIRAPYVNKDGFRFTIYNEEIFSKIGKLFGMQDVIMGYPDFDKRFIIKGNDEEKLRALFKDEKLRDFLMAQPSVYLSVKDDDGWFEDGFPEGVDELYFKASGIIKDVKRLQSLYYLFAETLHQLCHIDSAYEDDPHIAL